MTQFTSHDFLLPTVPIGIKNHLDVAPEVLQDAPQQLPLASEYRDEDFGVFQSTQLTDQVASSTPTSIAEVTVIIQPLVDAAVVEVAVRERLDISHFFQ